MSFFSDLTNALEQDAAQTVLPVLVADLQAIKANPPSLTDVPSLQIAGVKLFNDLLAAQPTLSKDVVAETAGLLAVYLQKVRLPAITAAQPSAPTAATPTG